MKDARCILGKHDPIRVFNKFFLPSSGHEGKEYYECSRCGVPMVPRDVKK